MQQAFIRQAVYNSRKMVVAYQVSFINETAPSNYCIPVNIFNNNCDPTKLQQLLSKIGIGNLSESRPVIVMFDRKTLAHLVGFYLPVKSLVIEISPNEQLDTELLHLIVKCKNKGFTIIMGAAVLLSEHSDFLNLVNSVKVDIDNNKSNKLDGVLSKPLPENKRYIFDNVPSCEAYTALNKLYKAPFFKGNIFSVPDMPREEKDKFSDSILVKAASHVMKDGFCYKKLTHVLEKDTKLARQLIMSLNSILYGRESKINSIKQAICFMGENNMRKFVALMATKSFVVKADIEELYLQATIRGRFCELLAINKEKNNAFVDKVFIVGLFSKLPDILGIDMAEAVELLRINNIVKETLLGKQTLLKPYYDIALSYEKMESEKLVSLAKKIGVSVTHVSGLYQRTLVDVKNDKYF
ncbi:EAL and HDOD domain-containing protein [Photobacterium sp.]|uniref:EAL and HDOD domain-containing protein n=1 Tax=Photobacterium sp. TaxID=660 RepID=UPI00299E9D2D|nr:HDOD domain-containing protein [Photobacterium sp.]MDX1300959.1 HDOD domain-containing protein [Photobacterium sp.]